MIRHKIKQNFYFQLFGARNHAVEIGHRTILRLYVIEVGNIIPKISHG